MAAASVPEIPFTADGRLRSRAVIPQSETCQKAGAGLPARPVSAPSRHLHVPVAVNAERSDASFPDSIKDLRQRVLPQIFTAFPLRPSRSLRASGNLRRHKFKHWRRIHQILLLLQKSAHSEPFYNMHSDAGHSGQCLRQNTCGRLVRCHPVFPA